MPLPDQQIGDVGRRQELVGGGVLEPLTPERDRAQHPVGGRQAQLERVGGIEQVLLVLLQVLVVGERESVEHAVQTDQVPGHPRSLGTEQLGRRPGSSSEA